MGTDTDRHRQTDRDRQTETDRDRQKQTETDRDRQRDRETERQAGTYRNSSPPGTVSLLERKEERKAFGCGTSLSKEFCANKKQCPIPFPLSPFLTMGRPAA